MKSLLEQRRYDDALAEYLRVVEEEYEDPVGVGELLKHLSLDVEELRVKGSHFLLGSMYWWGRGGVPERDLQKARLCFSQGAETGHKMCRFKIAWEMEEGAARRRLMIQLAKKGVRAAYCPAAEAYERKGKFARAAEWYLRAGGSMGAPGCLQALLDKRPPLDLTPYGRWNPQLQLLVRREVTQQQRLALLVCKRRGVSRDVAMLIAEFVCTP